MGGGNSSGEVKEWYYEFDGPQFAKDANLSFNGSSEDHKEEVNMLNILLGYLCPICKIVDKEVGGLFINYETYEPLTLFDLNEKIPLKFNELEYFKLPVADNIDKGITLIFKGTLEERLTQLVKMGEISGGFPDFAKYLKSITKEEYYSYLEAKEMNIYEFLEFIGNQ